MATTTTHYGFTKPGVNDYVDISVLNANFDNLDNVIYNNQLSAQAALDDIAPEYDATATYSVGDYVTYNKTLYRCTTAITTAEAFDDTKWTAVKVGGELKSHDARISDLEAGVELEGSATNSFNDGIDSYFKKVKSTIVPVQAGSGTPSPTNVRAISGFTECVVTDCGKNILCYSGTNAYINSSGEKVPHYSNGLSQQIYLPANTTFTISKGDSVSYGLAIYNDKNEQSLAYYVPSATDTNYVYTMTASGYIRVWYNLGNVTVSQQRWDNAQLQVELGSRATAYEPYKSTTATISFGSAGTVYGGYVDLISGKLVVEKVEVDLGTLDWVYDTSWGSSADSRNTFRTVPNLPIKNIAGSEKSDIIADRYSTISANQLYQGGDLSVAQNASYIRIRNTAYTDAVAFKTAMSGAQVVYPLATPQEYQLTPAQLRSLVGANRLTSSTGEVTEVEYITNKTIAWLLDLIMA